MSGIVGKIIKPTAEILEHIGRRIPQALAKGHFRVGQMAHDAADHFEKAEQELARDAEQHLAQSAERDLEGAAAHSASSAAAHAAENAAAKDGEKAAENAAEDAERGLRPHDPPRDSIPGGDKVCATDPVDVATGEMLLPITDVALPGALPLVLERTHLSSYRYGRWFGPSWASTLDQRLQLDTDGVVFAAADGMRLEYPPPRRDREVLPLRGPRLPLAWSGVPGDPMRISDPRTGHGLVFADPRPAPGVPGGVVLRLVRIEDRNGRHIEIAYADDDTPALITHHGGYRIAVDRHPELPRVAAFRLLDADGPGTETTLARFGYDTAGDLTEVLNSSGLPLRLRYDDRHRVTGWTDRNGTDYGYEYDEAGRVVRTTGSDGCMSGTLAYDEETRTTTFTDSLGHSTRYLHNDAYRLIRRTDPLGNATVRQWDEDNRVTTAVTDPLGHTTRYEYDAADNLVAVVRPDGTRAEVAYNGLHLPVTVTDAGGQVWRNEYDERGNRLASTDPMGARTEYAYDPAGNLTAVTNALGARHEITSDPAGLPVALTDPLGHTTTARRDAFGRVVEATDPLGNTIRAGWTVEGRVTWCERADGRRETWSHDPEGNVTGYTDAAGRSTSYASSRFDVPAASTTPDGAGHTFGYDTELRLTTVTNPQGRTWEYEYDAAGRLIRETDFDGRTLTYTYDAAGQPASRTNGAGETIEFTRDALGRLVEHRSGEERTAYEYDAAGNLRRLVNDHAEIVREFDPVGRILSESVNGRTMAYAYDVMGRLVRRRTPSGTVSTWTYDTVGLPAELELAGHGTRFSFDALGRETSRTWGAGIALGQVWDHTSRLTGQTLTGAPAAGRGVLQQRDYLYDADDLLTEIQDLTTGTSRFTLDPAGRVTAVQARGWTETYAYDTLGNLTQAATPLDRSDEAAREFTGTRLHRAGRTRYEYDAQGRVVRTTKRLLNGRTLTRDFTWNAQDQLVATVTPDGEHWQYRYDPCGRRIAKRLRGADGGTVEQVEFAYSGSRLVEQTASSGRSTTWEYAPGTHRPLAQVDRGPAGGDGRGPADDPDQAEFDVRFHAIVTDLVGTPTELVSPEGEIAWQQRTTLWGVPATDRGGEAVDCPLRFPGQYADPETGWNYNHYRHYDPQTARYVSSDPLGLGAAPNPAAYVPNPHTFVDPLGLKANWEPADITWGGRVQYSPLDPDHGNRATGVYAQIEKDMLGGSTDAQIDPAGWEDPGAGWQADKRYNRGHLLGALLGGSNEDPRNFATMHEFANSPVMRHYELQIQAAVRNGDTVHYRVTPVYRSEGDVIPAGMTLEAHSENGFKFYAYSPDPKTRRALRAAGGDHNAVTLLNIPKCHT